MCNIKNVVIKKWVCKCGNKCDVPRLALLGLDSFLLISLNKPQIIFDHSCCKFSFPPEDVNLSFDASTYKVLPILYLAFCIID